MLNPFRYVRSVPIGAADDGQAFDRLTTILPVFADTSVETRHADRLVFHTTGFTGLFRTIGGGEFRIRAGHQGPHLQVALTLRPVTSFAVLGLLAYFNFSMREHAPGTATALFFALGYTGLGIIMMRGEAAQWTRQVCAAALGRPPRDIQLDPATPADYNTATAPELSSATV